MAKKFIPNSDSEFATMARSFAQTLAKDPERYQVSQERCGQLTAAVADYRAAAAANLQPLTRSRQTALRKNETRAIVEQIIREIANHVRANRAIAPSEKFALGIEVRTSSSRAKRCPQSRPIIGFVGATGGFDIGTGMHRLGFREHRDTRRSVKPAGAARLELFVELIAPDGPVPPFPGALSDGRQWYLRSYTRSPIALEYPKSNEPVRIVYWGRWASATGDVGPFSEPLVTKVHNPSWTGRQLREVDHEPQRLLETTHVEQSVFITSARRELPDGVATVKMISATQSKCLPMLETEVA